LNEFDDGLQIIPSNWLINEKTSFFPNYKNFKLYDRAVISMEIPNTPTTWDVHKIKKIFKKTGLSCISYILIVNKMHLSLIFLFLDDFIKAKEILSKAEYRSDLKVTLVLQ